MLSEPAQPWSQVGTEERQKAFSRNNTESVKQKSSRYTQAVTFTTAQIFIQLQSSSLKQINSLTYDLVQL